MEERMPGALASQWIPLDRDLWRIDRYRDFLAARRELLAKAANDFLGSLRDGVAAPGGAVEAADPVAVRGAAAVVQPAAVHQVPFDDMLPGVPELIAWLTELGMSAPEYDAEVADPRDGRVMTVAAAFWPNGLQAEAGSPVVLAPDPDDTDQAALESSGFQVFNSPRSLGVRQRLLGRQAGEQPWDG